MSTSKTAIYHMTEGEVLVRGTTDPTEAIRIIVESNYEDNWRWEEIIDGASRDGVKDETLTDEDRAAMVTAPSSSHAALSLRTTPPDGSAKTFKPPAVTTPGCSGTWTARAAATSAASYSTNQSRATANLEAVPTGRLQSFKETNESHVHRQHAIPRPTESRRPGRVRGRCSERCIPDDHRDAG